MFSKISIYLINLGTFSYGISQIGFNNTLKLFISKHIFKNTSFILNLKNLIIKKFNIRNSEDSSVFIDHILRRYYSFKFLSNKKDFFLIDCGSFNGIETFRLNQVFKKNNRNLNSICIEANKDNFEALYKNLGQMNNIKIYNKAVYHTDNEFLFEEKIESHLNQSYSYSTDYNNEKVGTISINNIIKKNNIKTIDILKIDIEGLEYELFSENTEWISKVNCFVIEYYHLNEISKLNEFLNNFKNQNFVYDLFKENLVIYKKNSDLSFNISIGLK